MQGKLIFVSEQPVPKSAADVCVKKAGVCDEIEEFCDTNQ